LAKGFTDAGFQDVCAHAGNGFVAREICFIAVSRPCKCRDSRRVLLQSRPFAPATNDDAGAMNAPASPDLE
jgi:hypothetical protein